MRLLRGGKQPAESFLLGVDFAPLLVSGETVVVLGSSVTARLYGSATDATATLIAPDTTDVSGSILRARLIGGAEGVRYQVEFRAATSTGNIYEQDVLVMIPGGEA